MNLGIFGVLFTLCATVSCNGGYELYENVGMLYKFYPSPKIWNDAKRICREENATLAMPANEFEAEVIERIFSRYPAAGISGSQLPDYVLLGFHDVFIEGEYITDTGLPIQYFFHKWLANQPDNHQNEDCGSLYRTGFLNDFPCGSPGVFICQKQLKSDNRRSQSDGCIPDDRGYIYASHLKSAYKLHLNIKKWADARTICESEGGSLAIVNSQAEMQFLVKMFNEPDNLILYAAFKNYALLGFHDLFKKGEYVTVEGDLLQHTGYTQWSRGQPDNYKGNERCGSMYIAGGLNDLSCDVTSIFFCEKKIFISDLHAEN